MTKLLIVGGGGHAREVVDVVQQVRGSLTDVVVYVEPGHLTADGRRQWDARGVEVISDLPSDPHEFLVAVGEPALRERLVQAAMRFGHVATVLISPQAVVSPWAALSAGVFVMPHAFVSSEARLGEHTHVNHGANVSHDAVLGSLVTLGPKASVTGRAIVGDRSTLGTGALVLPGVRVGHDAVVGAGAVVVKDVDDHATVKGNPAR